MEITICITTFNRPECLKKCIKSIRQYYPDIKILIANDGKQVKIKEDKNTILYNLSFDSGLSKKRNFLIYKVETLYALMIDDDFVFIDKTNLELMMDLLQESESDIMGGRTVLNGEKEIDWEGIFSFEDNVLKIMKSNLKHTILDCNVWPVHLCHNFLLCKKTIFDRIRWRKEIKLSEHIPFFYDCWKNGIVVNYTDAIKCNHMQERTPDYMQYRKRATDFLRKWMREMDIKEINVFGKKINC